jgi:hypothetical protein
MPAIRLDIQDPVELTEMLQFIKDWITGSDDAEASFAHFVGSPRSPAVAVWSQLNCVWRDLVGDWAGVAGYVRTGLR